jgi:DNA polymerase-3 subunit gamma/tau
LILTDQQRQRAGELAEKFDIAGLVYNISTLEKLRWAIKNSDTSRALLEASLLRFALSEHFLNVDELLSQLQSGASAGIKKKRAVTHNIPIKAIAQPTKSQTSEPADLSGLSDIQSIQNNWQSVLRVITAKLGPGTGGLLSSAVPAQFENGVLTLEFGASAQMQKRMCESNGRMEQIQALLSEQLSTPVKLKFETTADEQRQGVPSANQPKTSVQKRNELINDPAVKTVLMGLDATITGIEEE